MLKVSGISQFSNDDITIYKSIEINKVIQIGKSYEYVKGEENQSIEIFEAYIYGELLSYETSENIIDIDNPKINLLILLNLKILYREHLEYRVKVSLSNIPVYFSVYIKNKDNKEKVLKHIANNDLDDFFKVEKLNIENENRENLLCNIKCSVAFKKLEEEYINLTINQKNGEKNIFTLNTLKGELIQRTFTIKDEYSFIEEIDKDKLIFLRNNGFYQIPYILDRKIKEQQEYNIKYPIKTFSYLKKINSEEFFVSIFINNRFNLYHMHRGDFTKIQEDIESKEGLTPIFIEKTKILYYCKHINTTYNIYSLNILTKEEKQCLKVESLLDFKVSPSGDFLLIKVKNKDNIILNLINIIRNTKVVLHPPNYKSAFIEGNFSTDSKRLALILEENYISNIYIYNIKDNEIFKATKFIEKCKISNLIFLEIEDALIFTINMYDGYGFNIYKYNFINKKITVLTNINCKEIKIYK